MSDAETYLRDLRRALPIGCRRRFVAEVREHFASAADSGETEQVTIERLGPADTLARQLLADLRSGALGPVGRLSAALTVTRIALATALALAIAVGVAVVSVRSSSKTPTVQRAPESPAVRNGVVVRRLVLTLENVQGKKQQFYAPSAGMTPVPVLRITQSAWYGHTYGNTPVQVLRITTTSP